MLQRMIKKSKAHQDVDASDLHPAQRLHGVSGHDVISAGGYAKIVEILRCFFGKVRASLNTGDMGGAGLERREAPPPIMASEVENAAAGQDGHVPADDRTPTRIKARPRRNCFSRFQKSRKSVAEFLLHCTGYGTVCRRENSKLDWYG